MLNTKTYKHINKKYINTNICSVLVILQSIVLDKKLELNIYLYKKTQFFTYVSKFARQTFHQKNFIFIFIEFYNLKIFKAIVT